MHIRVNCLRAVIATRVYEKAVVGIDKACLIIRMISRTQSPGWGPPVIVAMSVVIVMRLWARSYIPIHQVRNTRTLSSSSRWQRHCVLSYVSCSSQQPQWQFRKIIPRRYGRRFRIVVYVASCDSCATSYLPGRFVACLRQGYYEVLLHCLSREGCYRVSGQCRWS